MSYIIISTLRDAEGAYIVTNIFGENLVFICYDDAKDYADKNLNDYVIVEI